MKTERINVEDHISARLAFLAIITIRTMHQYGEEIPDEENPNDDPDGPNGCLIVAALIVGFLILAWILLAFF